MDAEHSKQVADAISISTLVGTLAGVLPAIAALVTIVWTMIRIFETETVKRWMAKCRGD